MEHVKNAAIGALLGLAAVYIAGVFALLISTILP
jgi:hypothetical protein